MLIVPFTTKDKQKLEHIQVWMYNMRGSKNCDLNQFLNNALCTWINNVSNVDMLLTLS